ncbi:MAG: protein kinase [Planctomycetales bacterium]|nr:protein kinase [Planctomycetales bacterium]
MTETDFTADFTALPLDAQQVIDTLCLEFEDRWLERPKPDIQFMLSRAPGELQQALLVELLKIDIAYRRRSGESVDVGSYQRRLEGRQSEVLAAFGQPRDVGADYRPLAPGDAVGRYRVLKLLGEGRFGEVCLARDEVLGRDVALKTVRCSSEDDRLLEEARTAARLKHPGIAAVYDAGRLDGNRVYIVMEHVDGPSLHALLQDDALRYSPHEAGEMIANLADAVDTAHRAGVLHRDLQPGNVVLAEHLAPESSGATKVKGKPVPAAHRSGQPVLVDFGLAIHELRQREHAGEIAGSLAYMSPELLRGETHHLDGRSDVWSLGVLLYQLLTGRLPFGGATAAELTDQVLHREPKPLTRHGKRIRGHLERACLKCLRKSPRDRCATAGELAALLRSNTRRKWLSGVAAGGALAATALVWRGRASERAAADPQLKFLLLVNDHKEIAPLSPVRPQLRGDQDVFLEIETQLPMHLHAWWIAADGEVTPMHSPRSTQAKTERLRLPESTGNAWTVPADQPGGLETVLVLASHQLLSADPWQTPVPPTGMDTLTTPAWFVDGERDLTLRAGPRSQRAIHDRLAAWHRRLAQRFEGLGQVRAVTFYCVAGPE